MLAQFFELGLDRSGCTRGVASSNTSCRKRTHDRYFTHGTASVMRMCRAGQQMCVLSRTAGIGPRLAVPLPSSLCHRRRRRAPSVRCAPVQPRSRGPSSSPVSRATSESVRVLDIRALACCSWFAVLVLVLAVAECLRFAPACSCFSLAFPSGSVSAPPAPAMLAMVLVPVLGQALLLPMSKPLQLGLPLHWRLFFQ